MKKNKESQYKNKYSLEERKKDFEKIIQNYSNKIPVIIEKSSNSKISKTIKTKYIFPNDLKMSELIYIIREKLKINKYDALYFIVDEKYAVTGSELLSELYHKYKDKEDNFLYLNYSEQQIFG